MSRTRLTIIRGAHKPSLEAGHHVAAVRIVARIGFATDQGWTGLGSIAIVDTGAPLSLFPQWMWQRIQRRVLSTVMVGGVAEKPECKFSADLAVIRCVVSDGISTLGPFEIHALLAHNDKVPALLGISGVLEQADLSISVRADTAWLETA
jgi:hypothetical protein